MDPAGGSPIGRPLSRSALFIAFIGIVFSLLPGVFLQAETSQSLDQLKQLSKTEHWEEVLRVAGSDPTSSAERDFYIGNALAHLGRWEEARIAYLAGARISPQEKRFPQELAGVAFKQKQYSQAVRYLQRALKLDTKDSYTLDFLGTLYFLEGNLEAALKYWNQIAKPRVEGVILEPAPRIDPAILDQTFAFSPKSTLRLSELLSSEAAIRELGIFPSFRFDLQAQNNESGSFDLVFRNSEKDGCGGRWECLFSLFRGLPAQSVHPEFFNLWHRDINLLAFYRWDAQKRRVDAELSGPFSGNPKLRYHLLADLRSENWNIRNSFTGPAPLLASLNLRREAASINFVTIVSGRWQWSAAAELSYRDFRNVFSGMALSPNLLATGYQLKQITRVDANIWRVPERRLSIDSSASSQLGRIWSNPYYTFEKLQGSLRLHWLPKAEGDDYEFLEQVRAGKTLGIIPFDELYTMGVLGDTDLLLRAHIATRDGRKGSAPLGSDYFLSNWEVDKNVYQHTPFAVKVGPFLDTGKITDTSSSLGSPKWLWDMGAQVKTKVFGMGVVFAYGKDLRSGNNAITIRLQ
ncbi:MAG TPA: tetratricopeptide repeat protein [Terriglobales bacterium]|nr:tetratricopeptide repeat protein [Terriglobales bacterium]